MAWAKGTATDFMEFLRNLRDYASGVIDPAVHATINQGVQVPVDDRWAVQTNGGLQPTIPGSGMATDGELYLIGPGSDPDDEIVVGIKTYRNVGNNIFGWEIKGYTQFNSALAWTTMPGVSPSCFATFDDAVFNCHFWVNRRRVMALAVIGTTPVLIHFGFVQQFGSRLQYPYPLLIGGSVLSNALNYQVNHFGQSCFPDPCENGGFVRWVDGTWQMVNNYIGSSALRSSARSGATFAGYRLWPLITAVAATSTQVSLDGNEENLFENYSTTGVQVSSSEIEAFPLFPVILHSSTQLIGRLDGLYVSPGLGLITGDTITIANSPPDVYDVFSNTWRTEAIDFFALLRE